MVSNVKPSEKLLMKKNQCRQARKRERHCGRNISLRFLRNKNGDLKTHKCGRGLREK